MRLILIVALTLLAPSAAAGLQCPSAAGGCAIEGGPTRVCMEGVCLAQSESSTGTNTEPSACSNGSSQARSTHVFWESHLYVAANTTCERGAEPNDPRETYWGVAVDTQELEGWHLEAGILSWENSNTYVCLLAGPDGCLFYTHPRACDLVVLGRSGGQTFLSGGWTIWRESSNLAQLVDLVCPATVLPTTLP